jgi:signal transduction histidine kinase
MKQPSLSLRLLVAAAVSTTLAVVFTWFVISKLFEQIFQERLVSELSIELDQLTDTVTLDPDGNISIKEMADLRYAEVFSGLYWQIQSPEKILLVSRSLWDQNLKLEYAQRRGEKTGTTTDLPVGSVLALSWTVDIDDTVFPDGIMLTIATDLGQVDEMVSRFQRDIAMWMALLTATLILASWFQVRVGLRPLEAVRSEISKLRKDYRSRLPRSFPKEIVPLVDEVNQLLDSQEKSIDNARNRAANLAHGLKTPLTVIEALADETRTGTKSDAAKHIAEQIKAMNAFVDRELVKSRHEPGQRLESNLAPIARRMIAAVGRLPADQPINWEVRIPEKMTMPVGEYDLTEILGNLLDNARKHARSRVTLSACDEGYRSWLSISDDGDGVPDEKLKTILKRGTRIAGKWEGYGLGLAIVEDLAKANGCSVSIDNNADGGLEVTLSWSNANTVAPDRAPEASSESVPTPPQSN